MMTIAKVDEFESKRVNIVICSDGFLNLTELGRNQFHLSECFQLSVSSLPSIFLLIGALIFVWWKHGKYRIPITRIKLGPRIVFQLFCVVGIFVTIPVELVSLAIQDVMEPESSVDLLHYISPCLCLFSLVVFLLLSERERRNHQPRSQLLFLFTLMLFICGLPRFVSLCRGSADSTHHFMEPHSLSKIQPIIHQIQLGASSVYLCLSFALFLIHCFSPHNSRNSLLTDPNACPELWASVPSLWTFAWMTNLVWKAFRVGIQRSEDVFTIPPKNAVKYNYQAFWKSWTKFTVRSQKRLRTKRAIRSRYDWSDREPLLMAGDQHSEGEPTAVPIGNVSVTSNNRIDDVPEVSFRPNCDASCVVSSADAESRTIPGNHTWIFIRALMGAFGFRLFAAWFVLLFSTVLNYAAPLLLGLLLRFLSASDAPAWQGYAIAGCMGGIGLINMTLDQQGFYNLFNLGIAVRSALTSAIYRKSTRLSAQARSDFTTGELVNLLTVDVNRIMEFFMFSFLIWTALVQFILSFYLLWRQLGVATFAGVGCLLLLLPLSAAIMWCLKRFETSLMKWKDMRMKCLGELFGAIKIIKLYAWEAAFQSQVMELRKAELRNVMRVTLCWGVAQLVWSLAPYVILLATFVTYTREFIFSIPGSGSNWTAITPDRPQLLDPERIFVSVSIFNLIREPLIFLPWSLSATIMAFVSFKRVGKLLLAPELDELAIETGPDPRDDEDATVISFDRAAFSWTDTGPLVLSGLDFHIKRGWLVAVVGTVGSGKSSLLSACLGDLIRRSGTVRLRGTTAYVPQTAWIQQQTIRENICFGESLGDSPIERALAGSKRAWYERVIEACALLPDLERLPAGDKTEIGERGVNLSGGQRQRVSLARAVFQDRDIYLLDDPLSAVDAHVGRQLFEQVIGPNGLLKNKTRLISTNAFHWLEQADWLIVLNEQGELAQSGTYHDIVMNTSGHFAEYLQSLEKQLKQAKFARRKSMPAKSSKSGYFDSLLDESTRRRSVGQCMGRDKDVTTLSRISQPVSTFFRRISTGAAESVMPSLADLIIEEQLTSSDSRDPDNRRPSRVTFNQDVVVRVNESTSFNGDFDDFEANETPRRRLSTASDQFMTEEEVLQGRVSWASYMNYLLARGWLISLISVVIYACFLAVQTFSSYWLQWFADDADLTAAEESLNNETIWNNDTARGAIIDRIGDRTLFYIQGYAWSGLAQLVFMLTFMAFHIASSLRASKVMHRSLLNRMLHAPASFFDRTPLGRILNRFSNDIENLDRNIPDALIEIVTCAGDTTVSLIVVIISLRPLGLGFAVVGPLVLLCSLIQTIYLPCSRQARRLDAVTRSPLLSNFGETAASALGASVVRAFGRTEAFMENADCLIDRNAAHGYMRYASNRWLDVSLTIFNQCMILVVTCVAVCYRSHMSAGLAGLLITYALESASNFTWLVKQLSQFESSAVSLERIHEYTQVEQEASWENGPDSPPPADWPTPCCEVRFNRATVLYNPLIETDNQNADDQASLIDANSDTNHKRLMEPALKSVDLVLSGTRDSRRIGIVGRTGAGKSSLASCIFRLIEATVLDENRVDYRGPVIVDGVDLARVGLHELRSRFSILPQEPVLFSGKLRFNLDPFGVHSDEKLWAALEASHLDSWAHSDGVGLDYECGEGGCNLSAGQRQLVCLARVCLSSGGRVRLLILDEATAAMDPITDNLVMQTVVGNSFRDATVIIIAHRLDTVLNTDMIVVLDRGVVVETGRPRELLSNPHSRFALMFKAGQ